MAHRFGWCQDGNHPRCRREVQVMSEAGKRTYVCSCRCHEQKEDA